MPEVLFDDIGLIDYKKCWDYQEELFNTTIAQKVANRKEKAPTLPTNHLIFCEHPNVFTLGKSGTDEHLLLSPDQLQSNNALYYKINRGGDITFHGPGQIVAYPILDLDQFFTDIHKYLRILEEAVIKTLAEYNIVGERYPGYTGVWLDVKTAHRARKICAMGVRCSRWVTMHGLALNVNTDLRFFDFIVPCGIQGKSVTSMQKELGHDISTDEVKQSLRHHLITLLDMKIVNI